MSTFYSPPLADAVMNYGFKFGTHYGFDMIRTNPAETLGSPLLAVADGTVMASGSGVVMGYDYGNWIEYRTDDGMYVFHAHAKNAYPPSNGARLARGQQLNQVGATGNVTGPHVHTAFMTGHLNKPTSFDGWPYINARLPPTEEDMSFSIVPIPDGPIIVGSQITGIQCIIASPYHVSLLQRFKANNSNDPMLQGELNIVKAYLQVINPPVAATGGTVDVPTLAKDLAAALTAAGGANLTTTQLNAIGTALATGLKVPPPDLSALAATIVKAAGAALSNG